MRSPWVQARKNIRQRCENKKCPSYKYYGGKGIKRRITSQELKILFFRDKAWLLKEPSIDRIDSAKDYVFDNCRWIEKLENSRRVWRDMRKKNGGPTDHGESVRIRTDLVNRARAVSKRDGPSIKFVLESVLDKALPTLPLPPKK